MQTAYERRQFDGQDPGLEGGQLWVGADVDAFKDHPQVSLVNGRPVVIIGGGRGCRIVFEHGREKRRGSRRCDSSHGIYYVSLKTQSVVVSIQLPGALVAISHIQ